MQHNIPQVAGRARPQGGQEGKLNAKEQHQQEGRHKIRSGNPHQGQNGHPGANGAFFIDGCQHPQKDTAKAGKAQTAQGQQNGMGQILGNEFR